jgi:photosystem II stability/assembly factor-like uncharacterized protein
MGATMATWTRSGLGAGLALLAAACGSVASGSGAGATSPRAVGPAMTVTPDSALTGGQPLRLRMTGFPPDSTIEIYECVAPGACDEAAASYAGTGSSGSVSATFIAQPSVLIGSGSAPSRCDRQCFLDAVVVKEFGSASPGPALAATARLVFSTASQAAAADLAYSSLLSTSWVSATEGWALAAQPCASGTCTRLARTSDAGRHWQVLPDPPARIQDGTSDCSTQACVSQVSFASSAIGYLYGPALLMSTDGGLSWHARPGPQTETLTIAGGLVFRVTYTSSGCPGPCQPSLQEAPAGSASWRTLIGQLAEPGRSNSAQIATSGPDVLVAMYGSLAGPVPAQAVVYRSADGGGTWRQVADPCDGLGSSGPSQEEDLIGLAAAPGGFFAGVCAPHSITSTFVITSADAGATWRPTGAPPPGQLLGLVAAASPATIAVGSGAIGGNGSDTARLLVTTDEGRHWVTAATDTQNLTTGNLTTGTAPAWLSFETPLAGQWLGDPHGVWTTTDGGLHWARSAFR